MNSKTNQHKNQFIQYLPEVKNYLDKLEYQDLWWTTVAMVGKINNENIDPQLLESIVDTQMEFQKLRTFMIDSLIQRHIGQVNSELLLKAQASIDIIIRNLFERTADVGFLATDDDLIEFMQEPNPSQERQAFIHHRIQEYVAKYSVYDDILLVSPQGEVQAKLNPDNPVTLSQDPLIREALSSNADYVEVYRYSDLFPNKSQSLIYAKRIETEINGQLQPLGVLCLSFEFDEEMASIFPVISSAEEAFKISIVEENGQIIASNGAVKTRKNLQNLQNIDAPISQGEDLLFLTKTTGYQGFMGLPWFAHIQCNLKDALNSKKTSDVELHISKDSPIYQEELEETNLKVSTLLLIVILNGKISSLKKDIKSFLPVLDSFQNISNDIKTIFADFIDHIHHVLISTIESKVTFSSTLAIEIMDRNLYERANDCRWWALNSTFRKHLSLIDQGQALTPNQTKELEEILVYINGLYTVYTNLILYNKNGKIISVSDEKQKHLIGQMLPRTEDVQRCMKLESTQSYVVSDFHQSALYDNRHTYIYHAAVKDWQDLHKNVGGIAIVFDSEPEFEAMLSDTRPSYSIEAMNQATICLFTTSDGQVISSTDPTIKIGSHLDLPNEIRHCQQGDKGSMVWQLNQQTYVVGYKMTEGYREYKNGDGYQNDVLAMVLSGIN